MNLSKVYLKPKFKKDSMHKIIDNLNLKINYIDNTFFSN